MLPARWLPPSSPLSPQMLSPSLPVLLPRDRSLQGRRPGPAVVLMGLPAVTASALSMDFRDVCAMMGTVLAMWEGRVGWHEAEDPGGGEKGVLSLWNHMTELLLPPQLSQPPKDLRPGTRQKTPPSQLSVPLGSLVEEAGVSESPFSLIILLKLLESKSQHPRPLPCVRLPLSKAQRHVLTTPRCIPSGPT